MTQIEEYNKKLIDTREDINILEYSKQINYLTNKIDLSFLQEFIELIDKEDFCIDAKKIYELKIFENISRKDKNGNDIGFHSGCFYTNILKNYKENVDFSAVEKSTALKNMRGLHKTITYMLKPNCFKKILMRNRNTDKYADYYLFLEKILKYYNDYQNLKLKVKNDKLQQIIHAKEDKIDLLIKRYTKTNTRN